MEPISSKRKEKKGGFLGLFQVLLQRLIEANNRRTTEAHGGTWFRTPSPNCRAEPFKRQRPDPVKRVGSGLRSQIGPLARRGIPGCLISAPEHERVRLQHSPNLFDLTVRRRALINGCYHTPQSPPYHPCTHLATHVAAPLITSRSYQ